MTDRHITINHAYPLAVAYFTDNGMYAGPRVVRNVGKSGHVHLKGKGTNEEFSQLIMASESDHYSVKGSF